MTRPSRASSVRVRRAVCGSAVTLCLAVAVGGPAGAAEAALPSATGAVVLDVSSAGALGSGDGFAQAVTPDGRFAVFTSEAGNLTPSSVPRRDVLYLRDRSAGTTRAVSIDTRDGRGLVTTPGRYRRWCR